MKKLEPSIPNAQNTKPQIQTICITSTSLLYQRYKPFVPEVQAACIGSKGLSEQSKGIIRTTARDYLNQRKNKRFFSGFCL